MQGSSRLTVLGLSTYLPPSQSVKDLVLKCGGDPAGYLTYGWQKICVAKKDDHPVSMCVAALRDGLENASIDASDLSLIICTSVTRDFLETANAEYVARDIGASSRCVSLDLSQGCVATLSALEVANGWLSLNGGGYAAIVSGERWSESINKSDRDCESLWGFSDGASSIILGLDRPGEPLLSYRGTSFFTNNDLVGHIQRAYGGTQSPSAPEGEDRSKRRVKKLDHETLQRWFLEGYSKAVSGLKEAHKPQIEWAVCNQGTPGVLEVVTFILRAKPGSIPRTGEQFGHVGCSDIVVGLQNLVNSNRLTGEGVALCCSPSTWGAALFEAPK